MRRAWLVALVLLVAGCGGGATLKAAAPAAVDPSLAPPVLAGQGLTLSEFLPARASFAKAGATSLVSDGRLWQLRQGSNLVGTLQISTVKQLDKFLTTQSQVYRVQSVGYFDRSGPVARVEAIIDTNNGRPRVLSWRNLSDLGRGFDFAGSTSGNR